jgi:hypothetical protein
VERKMKIRILIGAVLLAICWLPALAQNVASPPERRVQAASQVTIPHRAGVAPWLEVRPDKRQYYAYRSYAPPELIARLDRPVQSPEVRALLTQRSAAFRSGRRQMRLTLDPDSIVSLGTEDPDDASSVALVDLGRSPDLLASLTTELRIDAENNYVLPTLSSRFARDPAVRSRYVVEDTLMVSVAAKNHSRVTILELKSGQWVTVSDLRPDSVPNKDPAALRARLTRRGGVLHYQGIENVAQANARAPYGQPLIREVSSDEWRDLASRSGIDNPLKDGSPTLPAKDPAAPSASTTAPPPTPTYKAYGKSPWCNRRCSASQCVSCCAGFIAAERNAAFAASLACHIASDLCPWCHAGCAAMTAATSVTMTMLDVQCISTCAVGVATPASNNPLSCPVQ